MYVWEGQTKDCPAFRGGPREKCRRCHLEKWKHFLRAFWLCDGSGFCKTMYRQEHTGKTWVDICHGCKPGTSMQVVAEQWYAHRYVSGCMGVLGYDVVQPRGG